MDNAVQLPVKCSFCGKTVILTVPASGLQAWQCGTLIQEAFPELTPAERELMISGMCGECWKKNFGEEEE